MKRSFWQYRLVSICVSVRGSDCGRLRWDLVCEHTSNRHPEQSTTGDPVSEHVVSTVLAVMEKRSSRFDIIYKAPLSYCVLHMFMNCNFQVQAEYQHWPDPNLHHAQCEGMIGWWTSLNHPLCLLGPHGLHGRGIGFKVCAKRCCTAHFRSRPLMLIVSICAY